MTQHSFNHRFIGRVSSVLLSIALMTGLLLPQAQAEEASASSSQSDPAASRTLSWTLEEKHANLITYDYAYGNGVHVAVGDGIVKSSKDGIAWEIHETGYLGYFKTVVYGGGKFIAFGQKDYYSTRSTDVWTSTNGVDWTPNELKISGDDYTGINDAAWNGKRFVAVGGTSAYGYLYSSEDGKTWTRRGSGLIKTDLKGIAYGNGLFVAAGYEGGVVAVSKDGIAWSKVATGQPNYEQIWSIAYGNGVFVAVGDYTIMTSKDGKKWKYVDSVGFWSQVDWAKDRFILTGGNWTSSRKDQWLQISKVSKDGATWTNGGPSVSDQVQVPYYSFHNGKQYVTVTSRGVKTSTDAQKWTQAASYPIGSTYLSGGAAGNGKMVVVGGSMGYGNEVKLSSMVSAKMNSYGTWAGKQTEDAYPLASVTWTGTEFLGVGYGGTIRSSADGVSWKALSSPTKENLYKIIKAGKLYYAAGANGVILASADGKNWAKRKTNTTGKLYSIAWSGSEFVAVGQSGLMLRSTDGVNWTKIVQSFKGDYLDIAWGGGTFAVTLSSYYANADTLTVIRSTDGLAWSKAEFADGFRSHGASTGLFGIAYVGDHFIGVGSEGSIFLSPDAIHWTKQPVLVQRDLVSVFEFEGKAYVVGNGSVILSASLSSLKIGS